MSWQTGQRRITSYVIRCELPDLYGGGKLHLKSNILLRSAKWWRGPDCSDCTCYSPVLLPNGRPILKADSIHLRKHTVTIELREQVLAQPCIKRLKLFLLSFQIAFCKWPYSSVLFFALDVTLKEKHLIYLQYLQKNK